MPIFHLKPHPSPQISVIIPSRDGVAGGNVERLRRQLQQQRRIDEAEIILVVGESPNGHARNVGVDAARGRWLVFMDDDAGLRGRHVLEALLRPLEEGLHLDGAPVGMTGSATALPDDASRFQRRVAAALPRALYPEVQQVTETDMAHHLCCALPRQVYEAIGRESDTLETGTDVDLRQRLRSGGYCIAVVPQTVATHPQPDSLRELWRKHVWYGCGRVQLDRLHPREGRHVIRGGRRAVIFFALRALLTAPLRALRYDRASPWRWNPLLAMTDLAQKLGYSRAYWRDLHGLGPRWEPLGSSRHLERLLRPRVAETVPAPPAGTVRRLLVVLTAGMGDALTFLPTLEALHRAHPQAKITVWVAHRAAAEVVRRQSAVEQVVVRSLKAPSAMRRLGRKLRLVSWLRLQRFDLAVVNFINSNEETAVLLRLGGVPRRLGYVTDPKQASLYNLPVEQPPLEDGPVAAVRHLSLLDRLGVERPAAAAPRWLVNQAARARAAQRLGPRTGPRIGLHPGSGAGMAWKRWPVERFAALADDLGRDGSEILIFGGPDERHLAAALAELIPGTVRDVTDVTDLDVTAALMEDCDLMVVNDSGLYNLALMVAVPVVAIFGPTLPALSGPWRRPERTETVFADLACRPCVNLLAPPARLNCPVQRRCLKDVSAADVAAACRRMLAPSAMAAGAGRDDAPSTEVRP